MYQVKLLCEKKYLDDDDECNDGQDFLETWYLYKLTKKKALKEAKGKDKFERAAVSKEEEDLGVERGAEGGGGGGEGDNGVVGCSGDCGNASATKASSGDNRANPVNAVGS